MNRKYSTLLTMGLLLAGSLNVYADKLANHVSTTAATEVKAGAKYLLVQQDAGSANLALGFTDYNLDTKVVTPDGLYLDSDVLNDDEYKKYVWTVSESESLGKVTFTLTNAYYNLVLYVQDNGSEILTNYGDLTATAPYHSELAWTSTMNKKYKAAKADGDPTYLIPGRKMNGGWTSPGPYGIAYNPTAGLPNVNIKLATSDPKTAVTLYEVTDAAVSDTELNELYNTNGFNFDLTTTGVDNIFADQKVKAIKVAADIQEAAAGGQIKTGFPKGTYFAVSTPEGNLADASDQLDYLLNCTFIAVSPTDNATSDADYRKEGKGFKMTTVSGKDLNLFISTKASVIASSAAEMTSGDEVSVYNACFNVVKNFDGNKYALSLPTFRFQKATGSAAHEQKPGLKVAVMSDLNYVSGKTLATDKKDANQFIFKFAEPVIVKASELLSQDGASIFNIQFEGGAADGAYLTDFANHFYTRGEVLADLDAPAYQYIVTNVNGTNVTFKNRETGIQFTAKLYKEDDGCYSLNLASSTIASTAYVQDLNEDNNVVNADDQVALNGAHIQLIPATSTDKFNGYWNVDNETLVTLAFARDYTPTSNKLYPTLAYNTDGDITGLYTKMTDDVTAAAQWQLVKEKTPKYQTSSYAYLDANDKVVYKTKGDTVAVYGYKLQLIENGNAQNLYLKKGIGSASKYGLAGAGDIFYIKQNVDGSVAMVEDIAAIKAVVAQNYYSAQTDESARGIYLGSINSKPAATDIKTYLIQDAPEISLPIESSFVTMQSEMGNYISMNEDQDGILVNVDPSTVKVFATDSAKAIPSFYVSIGKNEDGSRAFMFNPIDSVSYYVGAGKYDKEYQWAEGVEKVIFKDAILNETADTLTTSIKGKVAKVAAKADRKGTLAGLDKFKFQIVKVDPDYDWYVIRQAGAYLTAINGKLTLEGDRGIATVFAIEDTTAPTANEAIEASEVVVIAGKGVVTVQGAAGKVITVANILGQTIANQVAASDNVTIAAPAGVVVVAVDGEATKVVVK